MKSKTSFADAVHLVRFAAFLWLGYLAVLAIINQSLFNPRQANIDINTLDYYFLLGLVALLCLGLSYWTWFQERLGKAFIPVMIGIITVLPMLVTLGIINLSTRFLSFNAPRGGVSIAMVLDPQSSVLRLIPFFLVAFLLVTWRYRWPYMLLIVLGITGLNFALIKSFPSPDPAPFRGALTTTLIQTVVFLAVGFSISFLMGRLRNQQQSLEAANTRLTHYASTLEQLATSRERNRLARELHDTLAHTLSGLSVQLETIKAYWDVDPRMARSSLDKSLEVAHSGLEETRRALQSLRASPLDDLGLTRAIKAMAESQAARASLTLNLSISDKLPALSPDVEQCVYRIAQEAITNVTNHANAKNMTIEIEPIGDKLKFSIRDDGVGFDIEKEKRSSHFGLTGMRERAQLVGGELDIKSKRGWGTLVQLTI